MSDKRVSVAKVSAFLLRRADSIRSEMKHYEAKADRVPDQREFYVKMAATERCAWMEVQHLRDVICGDKHDPNWRRLSQAVAKAREGMDG